MVLAQFKLDRNLNDFGYGAAILFGIIPLAGLIAAGLNIAERDARRAFQALVLAVTGIGWPILFLFVVIRLLPDLTDSVFIGLWIVGQVLVSAATLAILRSQRFPPGKVQWPPSTPSRKPGAFSVGR